MYKGKFVFVFLLLIFPVLLASCKDVSESSLQYNFDDAEEIYIGLAFPVAAYGEDSQLMDGVEYALEVINDQGGALGKPLRLLVRDDGEDANTAMQIAQTYSDLGISAVIGHWNSNICYYVEDIYEDNQVVMITPASTSGSLFNSQYTYIFRTIPVNSAYAQAAADGLKKNGIQRIAVYYSDNEYGRDFANEIEAALAGTDILVLDRVNSITKASVDGILMRWQAFGCEAVMVANTLPEMEEPLKLIMDRMPQLSIYGIDTFDGLDFASKMGSYAQRMNMVTYDKESLESPLLEQYRERYGQEPDVHALAGYSAVSMIFDAIESTGSTDGTDIAAYLSSLENYRTAAGTLTYNPETGEFEGYHLTVQPVAQRGGCK